MHSVFSALTMTPHGEGNGVHLTHAENEDANIYSFFIGKAVIVYKRYL